MRQCCHFLLFLFCFVYYGHAVHLIPSTADSIKKSTLLSDLKKKYYDSVEVSILPALINDTTIGPGNFVATNDIYITTHATLTLVPRTHIMFEPGKRLFVEGTVLAASVSGGKITFSHTPLLSRANKIPIADSLWGGITVEPGGSIFLNHTIIKNATIGITVSPGVKQIDFACVDMSQQVTVPVILNNKKIQIDNTRCVSTADLPARPTVKMTRPIPDNAIETIATESSTGKKVLQLGSGVITLGSMGSAAYGVYRYYRYGKRFENATDPSKYSTRQVDRYKKNAIRGKVIGIVSGITGVLGAALFSYTILF